MKQVPTFYYLQIQTQPFHNILDSKASVTLTAHLTSTIDCPGETTPPPVTCTRAPAAPLKAQNHAFMQAIPLL